LLSTCGRDYWRSGFVERLLQCNELIDKRLRDGPIEFDRYVPGDRTAQVDDLLGVLHHLLRRETRRPSAPRLAEVAQHMDLRSVHLAGNRPPYGYHLGLVDLAGGEVFMRRDRENAIDHARIEGDDCIRIAGARCGGETRKIGRIRRAVHRVGKVTSVEPPPDHLLSPALRPGADYLFPLALELAVGKRSIRPLKSRIGDFVTRGSARW